MSENDVVTTTTTTGYFTRLKNSLGGVLVGGVLFLASFGLLWWNEGRTVNTARMLGEASKSIVSVSADRVDANLEGRLIHVAGLAATTEVLTDPDFGFSLPAIAYERKIETYQWVEDVKTETKEKIGGGEEKTTTTSYRKEWRSGWVDSGRFKNPSGHANPRPDFESRTIRASDVRLGAYALPETLIGRIALSSNLRAAEVLSKARLPRTMAGARAVGDRIYSGLPDDPRVGDQRVSFRAAPAAVDVSVIGAQKGGGFETWKSGNGYGLLEIREGVMGADAMIRQEKKSNGTMAWLLRGLGLLLMWIGLRLVFKPLAMLLAFLPFLKKIAEIGIGVVTFLLSVVLSMVTMALAWLFYRPVLSISLLAVAVAAIVGIVALNRRKKTAGAT